MSSRSNRVWLVTGTSSGLGRALADAVVARGDVLVAAVRRPDLNDDLVKTAPNRVRVVEADVTNPEQVQEAVRTAVDTFGRIDVVVNNAGYGLLGGVEEATDEQIRRQFEVNMFGVFTVTRAALPVLRAQRSGHIFMVSSMSGQQGAAGLAWYAATKFAIEGFSEGLLGEVEPLGVKVTILEPGNFRTDWAGRSMERCEPMPDYEQSMAFIKNLFAEIAGKQDGDPAKAADAIIGLVDEENPPLRLVLGEDSLGWIKQKLERQVAEMDSWESLTTSVSFAGS
jgi:NAD(P)-dependent dehydrogenase (short-subunit alcohol dehydrogenase family)